MTVKLNQSLCNFQNKYLCLTGRCNDAYTEFYSTVQVHHIETKEWIKISSKLNIKRAFHSSCALNNSINVFGGISKQGR